jgi:CheY-like chemotaxis protein
MNRDKAQILYIDDEPLNIMLFQKRFERHYRVFTSHNGYDALKKLEELGPDLDVVISDMRMPGMSGVELIEQASNKFAHIAYFILSGFSYSDEIDKAVKKGLVRKFFTKPFEVQEILQEINTVLGDS